MHLTLSVRSTRAFLAMLALAATAGLLPARALAFDEDTHFMMTYAMLRAIGFTEAEAQTVASVDQGMDDSNGPNGTVANDGETPYPDQEWKWHALDRDGRMGASGVVARKQQLLDAAMTEGDYIQKLRLLGVYYHFQQDTWAHRHDYESATLLPQPPRALPFDPNWLSPDAYITYDTPVGHAAWGHQPDRPPFAPPVALNSLQEGVVAGTRFLAAIGRRSNPLFAGYVPANGSIDDSWGDSKKGAYFHQLTVEGDPGSARNLLTRLVRAQIDAYSESFDPLYLRYTTDPLPPAAMIPALQPVFDDFAASGRLGCRIDMTGAIKVPILFTNDQVTAAENDVKPVAATRDLTAVRMIRVRRRGGAEETFVADLSSHPIWNENDACGVTLHRWTETGLRGKNTMALVDASRGERLLFRFARHLVDEPTGKPPQDLFRILGTYPTLPAPVAGS